MELILSQEIPLIALPSISIKVEKYIYRFNRVDDEYEKNLSCAKKNNSKFITFFICL